MGKSIQLCEKSWFVCMKKKMKMYNHGWPEKFRDKNPLENKINRTFFYLIFFLFIYLFPFFHFVSYLIVSSRTFFSPFLRMVVLAPSRIVPPIWSLDPSGINIIAASEKQRNNEKQWETRNNKKKKN